MSRLTTLRRQLSALRHTRRFVRLATAYSGLVIALVCILAVVFLIDVTFEMDVRERVVVLVLAALAAVWSWKKFAQPYVGEKETDADMALLVEKNHGIDSDLIAAIQFEQPEAKEWGSEQLETAVVDYVAALGPIDVFAGMSREQLIRRGTILAVVLVAAVAACLIFPAYAAVFGNRLFLGSQHYPTDTHIEQIVINRTAVLTAGVHPADMEAAEGEPVDLYVFCSGVLPETSVAQLVSQQRGRSQPLDLLPLSLEQRRERLEEAKKKIAAGEANPQRIDVPWKNETITLCRFDAPEVAELLADVDSAKSESLAAAAKSITAAIKNWPGDRGEKALYRGELSRLVEPLNYSIHAGDAWTDPAAIGMIPLPVVEPRLIPTPPKYARGIAAPPIEPSARQISVLEGSEVALSIECTNNKSLEQAWALVTLGEKTERVNLVAEDEARLKWSLKSNALTNIREEVRYEIQVVDEHGLSLAQPIRGRIRLKKDRPPTVTASVDYRAIVPEGSPLLRLRLADDYGIGAVRVNLEIQRNPAEGQPTQTSEVVEIKKLISISEKGIPLDAKGEPLPPKSEFSSAAQVSLPLAGNALPLRAGLVLPLAPFSLVKGDRISLVVEAVDYRGDAEGEPGYSEAVILDVTDVSGVLAAMSEYDERSEKWLTDLIQRQQEQLGFGEKP